MGRKWLMLTFQFNGGFITIMLYSTVNNETPVMALSIKIIIIIFIHSTPSKEAKTSHTVVDLFVKQTKRLLVVCFYLLSIIDQRCLPAENNISRIDSLANTVLRKYAAVLALVGTFYKTANGCSPITFPN